MYSVENVSSSYREKGSELLLIVGGRLPLYSSHTSSTPTKTSERNRKPN